jgi:hypothetical protein
VDEAGADQPPPLAARDPRSAERPCSRDVEPARRGELERGDERDRDRGREGHDRDAGEGAARRRGPVRRRAESGWSGRPRCLQIAHRTGTPIRRPTPVSAMSSAASVPSSRAWLRCRSRRIDAVQMSTIGAPNTRAVIAPASLSASAPPVTETPTPRATPSAQSPATAASSRPDRWERSAARLAGTREPAAPGTPARAPTRSPRGARAGAAAQRGAFGQTAERLVPNQLTARELAFVLGDRHSAGW